jgi:hypothetical protein
MAPAHSSTIRRITLAMRPIPILKLGFICATALERKLLLKGFLLFWC